MSEGRFCWAACRGRSMSRRVRAAQAGTAWRYRQDTRNYSGWNLAANQLGWESLFDLLGRMVSSPWACRREISVSRPTARILAVPNNPGGSEGLESPPCLILEMPRGKVGTANGDWKPIRNRLCLK